MRKFHRGKNIFGTKYTIWSFYTFDRYIAQKFLWMVRKKYKIPHITMPLLTKISGVNVTIDIFNHSPYRFKPVTTKDILRLCETFKIDPDELFSDIPDYCFEPHKEVLSAFGEKYTNVLQRYGFIPFDRVQFVHIRQMYYGQYEKGLGARKRKI